MEAGVSWGSGNAGRNLSEYVIAFSCRSAASMSFSQKAGLVETVIDRYWNFGCDRDGATRDVQRIV